MAVQGSRLHSINQVSQQLVSVFLLAPAEAFVQIYSRRKVADEGRWDERQGAIRSEKKLGDVTRQSKRGKIKEAKQSSHFSSWRG